MGFMFWDDDSEFNGQTIISLESSMGNVAFKAITQEDSRENIVDGLELFYAGNRQLAGTGVGFDHLWAAIPLTSDGFYLLPKHKGDIFGSVVNQMNGQIPRDSQRLIQFLDGFKNIMGIRFTADKFYALDPTFYMSDEEHGLAIIKAWYTPQDREEMGLAYPQPMGILTAKTELNQGDQFKFYGLTGNENKPFVTFGQVVNPTVNISDSNGGQIKDCLYAQFQPHPSLYGGVAFTQTNELIGILLYDHGNDHLSFAKVKNIQPFVKETAEILKQSLF